jgi:hypothetical protein
MEEGLVTYLLQTQTFAGKQSGLIKWPTPPLIREGSGRETVPHSHLFSLSFVSQKNHQGEILLGEVAKHLDLLEKDYFGLAYTDEGMMVSGIIIRTQM